MPGFLCKITPAGRKVFMLQYRTNAGERRKPALGQYGELRHLLCADKGHALARYTLEGLPSKVMAANYRMVLPDAELLQKELENTRLMVESRGANSIKARRR